MNQYQQSIEEVFETIEKQTNITLNEYQKDAIAKKVSLAVNEGLNILFSKMNTAIDETKSEFRTNKKNK